MYTHMCPSQVVTDDTGHVHLVYRYTMDIHNILGLDTGAQQAKRPWVFQAHLGSKLEQWLLKWSVWGLHIPNKYSLQQLGSRLEL